MISRFGIFIRSHAFRISGLGLNSGKLLLKKEISDRKGGNERYNSCMYDFGGGLEEFHTSFFNYPFLLLSNVKGEEERERREKVRKRESFSRDEPVNSRSGEKRVRSST